MQQREATKPPAMPLLSDGIGMSFDQVMADLAAQHKTIVSKDDPILMVVTILNAFLTEEEKLLDRHRRALTTILADRTDHYVQAVEQTIRHALEKACHSSSLSEYQKNLCGTLWNDEPDFVPPSLGWLPLSVHRPWSM